MFEKIFQPKISKKEVYQRKKKITTELERKNQAGDYKIEEEKEEISRRDFMKLFGAVLGAAAAERVFDKWKPIQKLSEYIKSEESYDQDEDFNEEIYYDGEEPDIEAVKNIFNFNSKEKISINLEVADNLKNYWKYKYTTSMKDNLVGAMERIKPFIPKLKAIFNHYNIPEKYALLAIPESHWQLNAVSRAGAEGPYQFMPETGKEYGLMTSEDRRDPLKSANACALFLKDLYERTGDWNLALAGYNGGFMGRYLKRCKQENKQPTYSQFLLFLAEKANNIKQEMRQQLFFRHKVAKKETLNSLSEKYGISKEIIRQRNKIKGNNLKIGQVLKIPLGNSQKSKLFCDKVRAIAENLNYPPKFTAVYELVQNTIAWNQKAEEQPIS